MTPRKFAHGATLGLAIGLAGLAMAADAVPGGTPGKALPTPPTPAAADSAMASTMSDGDYANKMAMGDLFEITSSKLAKEASTNDDVKKLAGTIIDDHTASSAELLEILGKTGASVGSELDEKHQAMVNELKPLKGAEFDKAYLAQQIPAHEEALAMNQAYAATGGNNEMQRLADKVIPKIQMHLDMAKKLAGMTP